MKDKKRNTINPHVRIISEKKYLQKFELKISDFQIVLEHDSNLSEIVADLSRILENKLNTIRLNNKEFWKLTIMELAKLQLLEKSIFEFAFHGSEPMLALLHMDSSLQKI